MTKSIYFLIILIVNTPFHLYSASLSLQDTCISGQKIMPEKSFYLGNYHVGDSIYTKKQIINILEINKSTQNIMRSSKICETTGFFLSISGLILANIGLSENDPVLGFTGLGVGYIGIGITIGSICLRTKAIKVYNKLICSNQN